MPEDTIAELFARSGTNPDTLTRADLDRLIDFYRENRKNYKQTGTPAVKADKARPTLEELGL
jgi:hypothetical protein